jgi:hypothetical protein
MNGANRTADYATVAGAVAGLARRGFTEEFGVVDGRLRVLGTGKALRAEDLVIREYHRFEGISDPDDMAIVYGIEEKDGVRGTLVDAFGIYADPALSALLKDVPIRKTA